MQSEVFTKKAMAWDDRRAACSAMGSLVMRAILATAACLWAAAAIAQPANPPSVRDFGAVCDGVADDSPAVSAALAATAGEGRVVNVPGDCRLNLGPAARLAGHPAVLDGNGLLGEGGRDSGEPYGTRGGTLLLTDTAAPAFVVKRNWRLEHLIFFWPGQTEAAAVANGGKPVTMPALLAGAPGSPPAEISAGRFADNDVINAWDAMDFAANPAGGLHIESNRMFCLDACLKLGLMPLESFVDNNQFSENAYFGAPGLGIGPSYDLRNWAAEHGSVVLAVGDGTARTPSTLHVDGLSLTGNVTFGMGYGFRVQGGWLNLLAATGNMFDGTARVMAVEAGGLVTGARITGGMWYSYTLDDGASGVGGSTVTPMIFAAADATPGSVLDVSAVTAPSGSGALADWSAPRSSLRITDVNAMGLNNDGGGGTAPGIRFSSAGGRLSVLGSTLLMLGSAPGACVLIDQPVADLTIVGNHLIGCAAPVSASGPMPPVAVAITGNVSVGTHGRVAYAGDQAASLPDVGNAWDVTPAGWSVGRRPSDGALVTSYRGAPRLVLEPSGDLSVEGMLAGHDLAINGAGSALAPWAETPLTPTPQRGAFAGVTAGLRSSRPFGGRTVTYNVRVAVQAAGSAAGALTLAGFPAAQQGETFCVLQGRELQPRARTVTITIAPGGRSGAVAADDGGALLVTGLVLTASGTCETAG